MSVDTARERLNDLDPNFLEAAAVETGWVYSVLYDELADDPTLTDAFRREEFNRRRAASTMKGLARVAQRHGVPFEFRRLGSNGQSKLLIKAGRMILIQEPILTRWDHPVVADYKRDLANMNGFFGQLELDLGDQPLRTLDCSGCVLGVLLHAAAGDRFRREDKELGSLMLALPDADYQQWILRADLHELAMFGRSKEASAKTAAPSGEARQEDNVVVTRKRKNAQGTSLA